MLNCAQYFPDLVIDRTNGHINEKTQQLLLINEIKAKLRDLEKSIKKSSNDGCLNATNESTQLLLFICNESIKKYETYSYTINKETLNSKLNNHDVPCVVCQSKLRSSQIMVPAKKACMDGWHKEYRGYLMSGHHSHGPTEYICVDAKPETVHGGRAAQYGKLMYQVEAKCGSLKCPPYVNNRELTCVVCSR
ncbi:hypothetical protein KUTeg_012901 [Tegillarca granosa]|uniref:Uncharacterized protein n=1 Tax=Tegillarca granosa TaxID=220873 RepID=A0ABQ9EVM4_TEGGR|nr:hypothetical protein KUTeg_012901 [Tegillarca granosa]